MALHWEWKNKVGEVTDKHGRKSDLFTGNAFLIAVNRWEEDNEKYYNLAWFFADEKHAKNCLGLTKEYIDYSINDYNWRYLKLDSSNKNIQKFISLIAKAKAKDLIIELY